MVESMVLSTEAQQWQLSGVNVALPSEPTGLMMNEGQQEIH